MIGLQDERGMVLGMWPASGLPGSGGVPDAYWTARPNMAIGPGDYMILDSDPATWSQNSDTGGEGVAWVYGVSSEAAGEGAEEPTASGDETGWELPGYGEILVDGPPGGWEGVVPGGAI